MSEPGRTPDLFDRLWAAFGRALAQPIGDHWPSLGIALGAIAVLALILASSPTVFLNDMTLDLFIPLDGAWRMHSGQWPHADFYTPIGALYYVLLGLGGPGPKTVIYANLFLLPFTTAAAVLLTRDRLPSPLRASFVAMIGLMTISPRTLDSLALVSHLASYNRHGWTLTTLVAAGVLLEPRPRARSWWTADAAVLAICAIAAFYLKVTFFALSGAILIVAVIAGGPNRRTALVAGVAALAAVAAGFALTETNALYLADLRRAAAAGAGGGSLLRADRFTAILTDNAGPLFALVLGIFAGLRTAVGPVEERLATRMALVVLAVGGLCIAIASQSHDHAVPTLQVLLLVSAMAFYDRRRAQESGRLAMQLSAAAALYFAVQPAVLDGFAITRHAIASRAMTSAPLAAIPDSPVLGVTVPQGNPENSLLGRVYDGTLPYDLYDNVASDRSDNDVILRDAWDLLHRHGLSDRRVASLTFSPSFPWMLGAPPPRHLPAWYDFQRTFTQAAAGDIERALSDSEVVLVPRVWRIEGIWDVYGPTVERDYDPIEQTALWTLWVRRRG